MNSSDGGDLMDKIAIRDGDEGENKSNSHSANQFNNPVSENLNFFDYVKSLPITSRIISLPDDIIMASKSSWRGRERVLAAFAGVFLASLVITTVLAYSVGLSTAFLQGALENDVFDAQIAFDEDPGNDFRTNDSILWESTCDEIVAIEGISDCGIVYGRQGIRASSFFDDDNIKAQPLIVDSVTASTGDWTNVSWDYPEATEQGPPINDNRPIRFYGDGVWDGELGERHSRDTLYGNWPSTSADAENNRSVILPSQIASRAGVSVNDTIDSLTFTFVTDSVGGSDLDVIDSCNGVLELNFDSGFQFCRENITVYNLKISSIYQEGQFGNPTLLFNPVMVSDSVLTDSQKLTLMDNDHGYLGISVDRNLLPSSSTSAATSWLNDLEKNVEEKEYADSSIKVRYNDVISGTITFLNIFLGIIQVFDYILMIPIIILSFSVLIYGLVLSLEQRKREISIQRVIGGTERNLSGMILLELTVLGFFGWFTGYVLALLSVPLVLDAVGFMSFRSSGTSVNPTLSLASTIFIILLTVGLTWLFGRSRIKDFLSIEIDEGVRKVTKIKKSRFWLHVITFVIGLVSFLESWIESNGGWGPFPSGGIFSNFIVNALLLLFGPFMLWIGGALVLGRLGAAGPRFFTILLGWSPLVTDIRRGLKGSGSSEAVNRLAVIMLLTLSIVTLAAVQGYTGTLVDERTTSAENGADLQVQFSSPMNESQARAEILLAIQKVGNSNIKDIDAMTSVGDIFTSPMGEDSRLRTWIVFDGHEDSLIWDTQALRGPSVSEAPTLWRNNWFTAGSNARAQLGLSSTDIENNVTIEYTDYDFSFGLNGLEISTTVTNATILYMGQHSWVPGLEPTQSSQVIVIGESTYKTLVGNEAANSYTSNKWFFELCDQKDRGCEDALRELSTEISNIIGVSSSTDWPTVHEENERKGGLIFGTPGLLSLQFVVASLASVASAFVFLSLVLTQRKRELAILQAIGASPNQIIRLVLFEIMSILLVSMGLGVILGLAIAESFNGFFGIFGFIFQIFLGESAPIDRELIWPWFDLALVNSSVLFAVVLALLYTTRKALKSDLAIVLKGE